MKTAKKFGVLVSIFSLTICACRPIGQAVNDQSSQVQFLTNRSWDCYQFDNNRLSIVQGFPNGFLSGYSGDSYNVAAQRLAGIPDQYTNYLVWSYQQGIFKGISAQSSLGWGVLGITYFTYGALPNGQHASVAKSISTTPQNADVALQHEIGHAVKVIVQQSAQNTSYSDFDGALDQLHSELSGKSNLIRSYARSDKDESWAEAFAQFYCSAESRQFIYDNLPFTTAFLNAVLLPPVWSGAAASTSGSTSTGNNISPVTTTQPTTNNTTGSTGATNSIITGSVDWLTNLLTRFGSSNNSAVASTPTTSLPQSPILSSPLPISVALIQQVDGNHGLGITFASAANIVKIVTCLEDQSVCLNKTVLSASDAPNALSSIQQIGDRNFYQATPVDGQKLPLFSQRWTLLGYSNQNALVYTRNIGFSQH